MGLTAELISEFAKITNDKTKTTKETTVYGTVVEHNGSNYVRLDGSDLLTPVTTTAHIKPGERVTVMLKNHTATVTGNITSPAARVGDVEGLESAESKIAEFEILLANKVDTEELNVEKGRIDSLISENVTVKDRISANEGDIDNLQASTLTVQEKMTAAEADISSLKTGKLDVDVAKASYATIGNLNTTNATVHNLESTYADFASTTTTRLEAAEASVEDLETKKLDAESAKVTYANIDFSNIGKAAMEYFYSTSGLIQNVSVGDATITGKLVGVTISGDLLEGNTVVAEKLAIKGEDGLYYKLNTDGITTEAEQTEYNSLNGQVIKAHTITADRISVTDLYSFNANIGGIIIATNGLHSGVKDTVDNTTSGFYMDQDGQLALGDGSNFIKYYIGSDGEYHLEISAASVYPVLAPETDLNNIRTPGFYVGENASSNNYTNCPLTSGTFTLEVLSGGDDGQTLQRLTKCHKTDPIVYERVYYTSSWGSWYGGWLYPTLTSSFSIYGSTADNQPRYRKDGRMVEVRGIVTPTSDIAYSNDIISIFTLPEGYRPSSPIYVVCQGSGNCVWLLQVTSGGEVGFSMYRNGNTNTTATAGVWLPFQVTFLNN